MNGRGQHKAGQAGGGGATQRKPATGPALPYLISPQSPPGGCKTLTEKTSAAAAAADAGLVFYNYGCHRIIHEIDIENRPEPRAVRGAPLASEGRYFIELNQFNLLFAVGAGNNFLRCTDAEGGRERPGKACLGPAGRASEVLIRCRTPLEQVRRRVVPEPCGPPS